MNDSSDNTVSRRTTMELLAGCAGYVLAAGPATAVGAIAVDTFTAEPSAALIKELVGRLDDRLLQGLAVTRLTMIESDYIDEVWPNRPGHFWEGVERWPREARQQAVDMLLPIVLARA